MYFVLLAEGLRQCLCIMSVLIYVSVYGFGHLSLYPLLGVSLYLDYCIRSHFMFIIYDIILQPLLLFILVQLHTYSLLTICLLEL